MQVDGRVDFLRPLIWSRVSGLMRFLTADQKQQRVTVCEEFVQIVSDDTTFLPRVIAYDESWIYCHDLEKRQQFSQWEMKSKVKSMLIIFFRMKGISHKEFVLAVNSAYICDGLQRLCENVRRIFPPNCPEKRSGSFITTTHHLTLPISPGNL
jgi:hypothetical protein